MRFVVPGMLMGTPAMITIRSPGEATPNSFGIFFDLSSISSVSFHSGTRNGETPQQRLRLLTVERWRLRAIMGCRGRSLDNHRAVLPDSLGTKKDPAFTFS